MKTFSLEEFKPTIVFLVKFAVLYLVGNLLYGLYVTSYYPRPDPVTNLVTNQTGLVLTACGHPVTARDDDRKPTTSIIYFDRPVLAVYEGCNGINTMIIFVSFLMAFGPYTRNMVWFIPAGIMMIHLANLGRITLLFYVSEYQPRYMYFTHKYLFTAILYIVIFILWLWWVNKYATRKSEK